MKRKLLLTINTLALLIFCNTINAQFQTNGLESDELAMTSSNTWPEDAAKFDVCSGALTMSNRVVDNGGSLSKSYLYIKVNGVWKNILTLRAAKGASNNNMDFSNYAHPNPVGTWTPGIGETTYNLPANKDHYNVPQKWVWFQGNGNSVPNYYSCAYQDNLNAIDYSGNLRSTTNKLILSTFGNDGFYPPNGDGGAPLPGEKAIQMYSCNGTGAYAIAYRVLNVPQEALSSGILEVRLYREWWDYNTNTTGVFVKSWTLTPFVLNAPTGLTASTNQCNKITLNWSLPYQSWYSTNSCANYTTVPTPKYTNAIYRNDVLLDTVPGNVSTFIDNTALVGVSYNYQVTQVHWKEGRHTYTESSKSNLATGSMKMPPQIATNFTASEDKCDNKVVLNWNQDATNLDHYDLGINDGSGWTTVPNLSSNTRSYTHTGVTRGVNMLYHLHAYNSCSYSAGAPAITNGISPVDPAMATNITAVTNTVANTIDVAWTDNAFNETKYELVRTDDVGNTVLTQLNANQTSYSDNSAASCRLYTYKIRVYNNCVLSGITSTTQAQATLPPPNLGNTFTSTKKLTASKGYFSNRVELSWSNNNGLNIDIFKIYRKQLGTALDSVQIAAPNAGSGLYVDNTADARVFYRYTIVGVKSCNGSDLLTNISSDIGFRNPTGLVSGNIQYNGGIAVGGVKVYAESSPVIATGNSVKFNPGGILTILDDPKLEPGAEMRCEFWFKPTTLGTGDYMNKNNSFFFGFNGVDWYTGFKSGGTPVFADMPSSAVTLNNWNHIAIVYNGANLKLFLNGVLKDNTPATGSIDNTAANLIFGNTNTNFYLDEFRLLGKAATDSVITTEKSRILNGNEIGFKCNLHFNENVGTNAYDVSKVGTFFNANHAAFTNTNVTWSSDIPTSSQLGYFGVTDASGNYVISGIQYAGSGELFNLTASYLTHEFGPDNPKSVFIGDATNVLNGQNFIDNSSFPVTGTLFYKKTSCPVPGAGIKLDGLPMVVNGQQAVTDANGTFSVSVPIGYHYISAELYGHDMDTARYPVTGLHEFKAAVSGIQFTDSTKRLLIGRIVGGLVEANKAPGMARSINNIGKAKLRLVSPITGTPCFTVDVITDDTTGEYKLRVPPLAYRIDSAFVITNSVTINKNKLSNTNQVIDLTNVIQQPTVVDTLKDSFGGVLSIDSIKYHKRLDFIYRSTPQIDVTRLDGSKFIGEDSLSFNNNKFTIRPLTFAQDDWGLFNYPVFMQGKTYDFNVHAREIYTNNDHAKNDTVLLSGSVAITNALLDGTDPTPSVTLENGLATYSFTCGAPNTTSNTIDPGLSYTKDLQVVVVPDGAASIAWKPNLTKSPSNTNYHGLVIGRRVTGTGVATQGPEKVDFILRDPPGSGSSASWTSSNSQTYSNEFSLDLSKEADFSADLSVGTKGSVGIGVETDIDNENSASLGLSTSISGGFTRGFSETVTSSYAVSTRDDADNVGAPADIFIGRSRNWFVGPTLNIELQDVAKCAVSGQCFGLTVNGKKLAKVPGYAIAPGETKTRFSYTQDEVETVVIPSLESLRNNILLNNPNYQVIASSTHSLFASNNDDPLWATPSSTTPAVYDAADTTGQSYIFRGRLKNKQDTVRVLNTQISLWKQALAQNEREKLECLNDASFLLDNFTLGSAIVTNAYETSKEDSWVGRWELSFTESAAAEFEVNIGGNGINIESSVAITETTNGEHGNSNTNTNALEYTLTDGDPGDIMSVDVYKTATGNVFITRGGQTMCPYEDAVVCHYYNSSDPSAWIGSHTYNANGFSTIANATVQREMPNIAITPAVQYNIPSDQPAVYQLVLSNQSPLTVNNDIDLQVRVDGASNANGAVCKIDGQNADNVYTIPSGGSLIKTLTIERGPIEIEYDSLMVIFSSACSSDIADTAYVSVHFIPTCTDLSINTPVDNFIVNNNNNSLQNIIIEDYNYNFGTAQNTSTVTGAAHPSFGLEKIGYEFKPANTSTWLQVQDFFKYPTAVGSNSLYPIPQGQAYTQYNWTVTPQSYADGNYEIRAVSYCYNKDGSYAVKYSPVHAGVMDRVNPHPFGTPTPGDGILDPNDDISIKFNEPIDISSLSYAPVTSPALGNFDIRGVLNETNLRHSESLNFDGAADYAEVSGGASLQKRPFTFEFWAKFNSTGTEQTVISQGTDPNQFMTIGFDASDKLKFSLGNQTALSTNPVSLPTDWHHYAVVYDYQNTDASLYIDGSLAGTNNNFIIDYIGSGKLAFGKAIPANNNFLNGNMHEVRLWNKARSISEITVTMNKILNLNQSGLVYNWKMDEADGSFANDGIRSRNATIYGATWEVNPNGNAAQFDGADDNVQVSSGNIAINKEMDFTLEFWFNSNQAGVATLFSNGAGVANTADSLTAWTIQKDASGKIHVYHKGLDFVAVNTNFFDANWHHFALVMQRSGNLSSYIDGNLQNSVQSLSFNNLAASNFYLGAKATVAGSTVTLSDYYSGKMDEFRLWNTARKSEQVKRDKQNRMLGDEAGLLAFVPFENYAVVAGTPSLTPTFNNQSAITLTVTPQSGTSLIAQTPTIKLPRPVQFVNYNWSLNNDQIILSTTDAPESIENVTLDITVQNAYDLHGNKMQSPKTWIAYINKNQVKWQDDQFDFEKTIDSVITFVAPIVNSGGAQKVFTIGGMPTWMTSSTTNGVIAPNSVQNVTFTIPAGQSVGDYNAGITVTTDFGYDEVLQINLKVKGVVPTWTVNTANYQYQMNIFGQLKLDGIISSHLDSKLAAFSNGQVRGVANLQYVPAYDKYEVYLNVYSNSVSGDSIYFNIYDGATGLTFVTVDSSLVFVDNDVVGTISNPRTFSANTEISRNIPLNAGWTWVSFPLKTNKMVSSNLMMNSIASNNGDIVTSISDYDQYDNTIGWVGNITSSTGYKNNQTYKIKKSVADTLLHIGSLLNPDSALAQINVVPGWNWIGFIASKNLSISEALGNYNAVTGDLIKSQYQFAYYDNLTGWNGSLTTMKPTMGYMLKSSGTSSFNYPLSGFFGARMANTNATTFANQDVFPFTPEQYSNTMSMIVKGNICNEALEQGNVALGVFDSGENLRGYVHPTLSNNTYLFYLTAYSNSNNEALSLKYFNTIDGSVISTNTVVTFNADALVGTPSQPFMATVEESLACELVNITTGVDQLDNSLNVSVYPNPFSDKITLQFSKQVNAKMEMVDVLGKVVYSSQIKGKKDVMLLNYNLADGVYYIRLTGDVNKQIKVVKTK